jgi:ATP-dependent exoDNAse (exonuclease V) alpha subunit
MGRWADDIHKMPKTTKGMAWRSWYQMKELFHIPDYSYCTTVHLQQGNTVDNIYVLEFDITHNKDGKLYRDNTNQLRLMYVAYTRARNNVYICNPNFTN